MSEHSTDTQPEDNYPVIDAKQTDRQLTKFFSNNFSRYTDFADLSKGGSATLRTCLDKNLGRVVVMKTLHAHLADREYARARFLREARVTAQLQHPNTVPVYEIGQDLEGRLYFTMKKVEGDSLREVLDRLIAGDEETGRVYNLDRLLGILIQVCNALNYAHAHGVVHRDVKPENIFLGSYGEVILLDWGVAKVWALDDDAAQRETFHEDLTDVGQRPGTPLYMAPEQVRGGGDDIDGRTDVYAVGAVLYEILTLKEPLRGERVMETFEMILKERPIPPEERCPDERIPSQLSAIAMRALEKDPKDRYQTMPDLIDAIRSFRSRVLHALPNK